MYIQRSLTEKREENKYNIDESKKYEMVTYLRRPPPFTEHRTEWTEYTDSNLMHTDFRIVKL